MQGWDEVRAWRKAEREALIARRLAVPRKERTARDATITARLRDLLNSRFAAAGGAHPVTLGFYWPFKGEYDPRPLARALHGQGVRLALPVVAERARPLIFREWWPGARMTLGVWDIPVPAEGEPLHPAILLVPLVGFDEQGYRLGYGGGYYDRTLAAAAAADRRPFAIGVGFELSRIATIHPQPHDVPMDVIVTERRVIPRTASAAGPGREEGSSR
ncbi:MAG: 5-formyltetrahydrofolate cyclo-ligase [Acetobacteraceae bacterium]|nr:5-formyltetrahydrofolate cyclo-ligase [Acetobacteraceae bacterium]